MRIMTFNIQHCHEWQANKINTAVFADTVSRLGADICGLNEVRGKGALAGYTDQMGKLSAKLECNKYFGQTIKVGGIGPYGNGLLSKYPIISAETVHIPDTNDRSGKSNFEHRGFISSRIIADGRELAVLVCHMGLSEAEQKNAVEALCDAIDKIDCPMILMGDFNTTPQSKVLAPLFERMQDTDPISVNPSAFTYASYEPTEKIDYLLYRDIECTYAETVTEIVSDHFPIFADFEFVN